MFSKKFWSFASILALALALNANAAPRRGAAIDVSKRPDSFITTIAEVKLGADGKSATVFADNDMRLLTLSGALLGKLADVAKARDNGWEVAVHVKASSDKKTYEILNLEVKAGRNVLTDGFSQPDKNFKPIIASSPDEIQDLIEQDEIYEYNSDIYDVNDNCFNRAQFWSRTYQSVESKRDRDSSLGTDKVFIFFSQAYISKFDHNWWYHVAPVVYLNKRDARSAWALDPTFMGKEAVTLRAWLKAFDGHTNGKCQQIQNIDEYYANNDKPICMYAIASMFHYNPSDLSANRRMSNWRCSDFERLVESIQPPGKLTNNKRAKWSDEEFSYLKPAMCRR